MKKVMMETMLAVDATAALTASSLVKRSMTPHATGMSLKPGCEMATGRPWTIFMYCLSPLMGNEASVTPDVLSSTFVAVAYKS